MAKILIIDDEQLTLDMLATFLQMIGHNPLLAIDGRQGWSILEYDKPEAILLDIQLPDTNGIDMCHEIRSKAENDDVPIIMISAHSPPLIAAAKEAGADDYLAKPIGLKDLQSTLVRHL